MDQLLLDKQLRRFLAEDVGHGDITTDAVFAIEQQGRAVFIAKQPLVAAGLDSVAARVFTLTDSGAVVSETVGDGERVEPGAVLLRVRGRVRQLLRAERVALNLVQRLCGIATLTAAFVKEVEGLPTRIVDTRKTTPGLRMLEKYAVRAGGGANHRFNLADGVLIKDNHIAACGSITEAVTRVRAAVPHTVRIEVETENLEQVRECLACGVDIIMLDNMEPPMMREAVEYIRGRALVEASGGMKLETVRRVAETGVDIISIGALTHSAAARDISMDWQAE